MGASPEEQQGTRMPDAITSVNGETEPSSSAAVVRVVVRRGEYHDPVTLMEASEAARWLAERGGARQVVDVGPYVFAGGAGVERMRWRVAEVGGDGALPEALASRA